MQIRSIVFMVSVLLYNSSERTSDHDNDFLTSKKYFVFLDLTVGILLTVFYD